ncbi:MULTISPECIES: glycosyltransferase family 4 protein [Pelosinus]|jgi:glycosyltransferase involved in cell wall biosynthesis|uniref:Glycosyl transferase group 1 n=1 Tax=Pelosinus fermentans B4 TaxID=1149862 RepID=I9L5A7_9FIRM|nr:MULTISPECIES: glycosyltransferase family 4 protein [Pelosinus]EIW15549.1 glycosyl transferase group 1 [Pelosinus fermentans B4]EIW26761.1 glycosyl transferase group 1 [Pelosinus fermentans A11]OAM92293.1 glycosyl transferase group 1 [Pelosinus fermentans DSM 17108]SDQ39897.1 Glycosyltransferase involved in cell wall bisynthesis [Pelosinus fermentans]
MVRENRIKHIGFLSTYPPRECGLATFTEDLVTEIAKMGLIRPSVIAVVDKKECENSRIKYRLSQHDRTSYLMTASWANDNLDLLVIEHEYGIFGGECGEYIIDLAKGLKIPFIITTHTVLLEPSSKQRTVLRDLGRLSTKVVTMAKSSMPILAGTYGIESEKLLFIPHGVPNMQVESRGKLKMDYGLRNKEIISSFGLISPAKGLEYGIEAVAKVVPDYENLMYLILGKTHPCVKESMGETYRQSLMDLAQSLGVQNNIRFIDKYLTKKEVITYLQMSDMYLTPYLSKEQAVSGTLAYAMGRGRVIVSTPYRYAEEMLGDGRGMLSKFKDSESMASCIRTVLGNPTEKKEMEMKTMAVGRTMKWSTVADQYAELCMNIIGSARPLQLKAQAHLTVIERNGMRAI